MSRSVDPYDALASIFLPGGGDDGDDASAAIDAEETEAADAADAGDAIPTLAATEASFDLTERFAADRARAGLMSCGATRPRGGRPIDMATAEAGPAIDADSRLDSAIREPFDVEPGRAPGGARRRRDDGAVELEMLVPGHLPVRAATWLLPCVRAIAGPERAFGLFRCDPDGVELELHGPAPEPPPARSLSEAIEAVRGSVRRWFVRPPASLTIELMPDAEPDRLTILTGGDPVAIASAWEVVRRAITGADERRCPRPRLGLAVVGVPRRQADLITEQLDRITRERLGIPVELRCCVPRITPGGVPVGIVRGDAADADPVRLTTLVRGDAPGPSITSFRNEHRVPEGPPASEVRGGTSADGRRLTDVDADVDVDARSEARPMGPLLGSGLADVADDGPGMPFVFPRSADDRPAARPGVAPTLAGGPTLARIVPPGSSPATPATPGVPSSPGIDAAPPTRPEYARHLAGLQPLPARSPSHPEVELAVDADGALHVLGGVSTVRELPLVAEWALTHADLLAMACPDQRIDVRRRPQGHVFTDDALAVSDLHQSQLHLHLLAEIEVDGRRGWFVSPLHRPRGH
jgi:hypothetical protein